MRTRLCLGVSTALLVLTTAACSGRTPGSIALIEPSYSYIDAGVVLTRSPVTLGRTQAAIKP